MFFIKSQFFIFLNKFFIGIILKRTTIWTTPSHTDEDYNYKNNNDKSGTSWSNSEIIGINIIIISIYLAKRSNEPVVHEFTKLFIKSIFKKKKEIHLHNEPKIILLFFCRWSCDRQGCHLWGQCRKACNSNWYISLVDVCGFVWFP